jgi:hypothetical protein
MPFLHYTRDCVQFCYVGDHIKDCFLIQFCDAGFAGDLGDSRSTGGSITYLIGPNTLVPLSWACKKQGAVSHSSTEAEIISLDAGLRCEGIPLLMLWEQIQLVMTGSSAPPVQREVTVNGMYDLAKLVDFVPRTVPDPTDLGRLVLLEDNDAVIKMLIKGRTDRLRHVPRTHRIDLDWLFELIRKDPGLNIKYISTKLQAADIFTKGGFTSEQFLHLMFMCCIARTTRKQDRELQKQVNTNLMPLQSMPLQSSSTNVEHSKVSRDQGNIQSSTNVELSDIEIRNGILPPIPPFPVAVEDEKIQEIDNALNAIERLLRG